VRAIILTFVEWGTISSQTEALDLMGLVGAPAFTTAEWQSPPLDGLIPIRYGAGVKQWAR
jgi:hypothetical protein